MADPRSTYQQELSSYWVYESRVAALFGMILVPAGSTLDWFSYPEHFLPFFLLRLLVDLILLGAIALYATELGHRYVRLLTLGWLLIIQLMICYMILNTGGAQSTYYAGLNLSVLVAGVVLPSSLFEVVLFMVATLMLYLLTCIASGATIEDLHSIFNNTFFLSTTGVIVAVSAYFMEKRRFREFQLKYQLAISNRELEEIDRQKTQFFANVSHELRTPLTLILAPVQEMLETGRRWPDEVASRLGVVRDNALRLLKLVNDLLDVIRLEEGKEQLERVPVDLNGMLSALVDGMTHLADTKEITLTRELCDERLVVRGDTRALEKIFVNLLNNAIKFTDTGGSIRVESRLQRARAWVSVSDTGIGIPSEEQPHIFSRFHQVDGSSTRRFRGTGLGLALVKEMTERMDGEVSVESAPGEGTTMHVVFDVYDALDDELPEEVADDAIEALHRLAERKGGVVVEEPSQHPLDEDHELDDHRPRLLVVEDEPDMRRYLTDLFDDEYQMMLARTGREGLEVALSRAPDLILLDLMLPELDGLEVCRRVRAAGGRRAKIMLLTARVDEQSKLTALEYGADDFLTKPFSSVEVRTRLRNLLQTSRLEHDLAERNQRLEATLVELKSTQSQLIQSEKLNALGSLAAGLLHEVNNPLNYSLTAIQLLRADPGISGNELLDEVVGDIDEGMQRIRAIVSDLRAFAYPSEAERQAPFTLAEACESALRFVAHDLKDVEVDNRIPAQLAVLGSKSHIAQVLMNLLNNAAQAVTSVDRPGRIGISADLSGERVHVQVSDNGVGMNEETAQRVFEPFFTTRDVGEGMGLGLSVCHTIVGNHGGNLSVTSKPGEGSRFAFDLAAAALGSESHAP